MYAKLVFRNAKRSVKDYLVYIVTMTICVTLFYAFLSISSSYYSPDIGSEYDFTLLSDGMKIAICMITLLLLFLIRFVNHCSCCCNSLLYPNHISRNFSLYRVWCIDVTNRGNNGHFGNFIDLLFHKYMDYF